MTNFLTISGKEIDFLNPDITQIDIKDIAIGLSRISKFVGQTNTVYTNAQHCLNLVKFMPTYTNTRSKLGLQALLHDAAEYACSDLATPIKYSGHLDVYKLMEKWLSSLILVKYTGLSVYDIKIKFYDRCLFYLETYHLSPTLYTRVSHDFHKDNLLNTKFSDTEHLIRTFAHLGLDFTERHHSLIEKEYLDVFNELTQ